MSRRVLDPLVAAACAFAAACSVAPLSLEGKQCPCDTASGYVCDEITNRCLATNDGGTIIDSPAATQCLNVPAGESEVYKYIGSFTEWQAEDPGWSGTPTEIRQASSSDQLSYTYPTPAPLTTAPDVHVVATMREINRGTGAPNLGIVLRAQLSPNDRERYTCTWNGKDRLLELHTYSGGSSTQIGAASIGASVPIPPLLTMEASIDGGAIACCIREISAARVSAMDTSVTAGYPGLQTNRMEAAFGSFVVFKLP